MDFNLFSLYFFNLFKYVSNTSLSLLLFTYFMLLSLILTIIYFFIRDKRLVNFNESQVELYDSGDNVGCSSSSDEGSYTSDDNDDDDEDKKIKLDRRRRR